MLRKHNITLHLAIAEARNAAGLTQDALAKRAGVDRTTIVKLEAGKGATVQTVNDVLKPLGLELSVRPASTSSVASRESKGNSLSRAWKLSFPYDWSNPKISEDALIASVLRTGRLSDVARICYLKGVDKVEGVLKEKLHDPYAVDEANRVMTSVRKGFVLAEQSFSAPSHARVA